MYNVSGKRCLTVSHTVERLSKMTVDLAGWKGLVTLRNGFSGEVGIKA